MRDQEETAMRDPSASTDRRLLESMFHAAVEAALPWRHIARFLPPRPKGRTIVVGAGKAASQMAQAVEAVWDDPLEGMVITGKGSAIACRQVTVLEAAHPVPDEAGLYATQRMLKLVNGLTEDDLVLALISGGGSAMMPAPADGLTLGDEQTINRSLLACGAPIQVMNLIRNQFSRVKGGRLAVACHPARVVSLVISDVPNDDPSMVSSGPTIPMQENRSRARELAELYKVALPAAAQDLLRSDLNLAPENDHRFARDEVHVIASASASLEAASAEANRAGLKSFVLSSSMEGEAREVGTIQASVVREVRQRGRPFSTPSVILSGGETTVTVRGTGRGGRNAEFLLSLAIGVDGQKGVFAMAADTDGIDGTQDNAGAFVDGTTVSRMRQKGIDPGAALANNDAYSALAAIGDLFFTGPTGTNVNDFRAIIVR